MWWRSRIWGAESLHGLRRRVRLIENVRRAWWDCEHAASTPQAFGAANMFVSMSVAWVEADTGCRELTGARRHECGGVGWWGSVGGGRRKEKVVGRSWQELDLGGKRGAGHRRNNKSPQDCGFVCFGVDSEKLRREGGLGLTEW